MWRGVAWRDVLSCDVVSCGVTCDSVLCLCYVLSQARLVHLLPRGPLTIATAWAWMALGSRCDAPMSFQVSGCIALDLSCHVVPAATQSLHYATALLSLRHRTDARRGVCQRVGVGVYD